MQNIHNSIHHNNLIEGKYYIEYNIQKKIFYWVGKFIELDTHNWPVFNGLTNLDINYRVKSNPNKFYYYTPDILINNGINIPNHKFLKKMYDPFTIEI
jgi:hypothetical protein